MLRSLILIAALALLYLFARLWFRRRQQLRDAERRNQGSVNCQQCNQPLPVEDAVFDGDHAFCNAEHRREWQSRKQS